MSDSVFSSLRADDLATPRVEVVLHTSRVAVVALVGEHDLSTKPALLDALARACAHPCVVVDLTLCTFVDSSVLSALVALHGIDVAAISIVVPDAQRAVRRAFELAGMAEFFPLHDSLEGALGAAGEDSPAREPQQDVAS